MRRMTIMKIGFGENLKKISKNKMYQITKFKCIFIQITLYFIMETIKYVYIQENYLRMIFFIWKIYEKDNNC